MPVKTQAMNTTAQAPRVIEISSKRPGLRLSKEALRAAIGVLDASAKRFAGGCPPGDLSLVFLTDKALAKIHGDFLDDPSITDVITFEGDPSLGLAGEICVSVDTALRVSKERGTSFNEELLLYVVHGWLHLAGYDDLKPVLKREMRRAEARAMGLLRKTPPSEVFKLR